jgi:hypothetical protein
MPIISRYLAHANLDRMKSDLAFLLEWVTRPGSQMQIYLRNDYFVLCYDGNTVAALTFRERGRYRLRIHREFLGDSLEGDSRFTLSRNTGSHYCVFDVPAGLLHPLMQKEHLRQWCRNISQRHSSAELAFEHLLVTENVDNPDVILLDRQVMDQVWKKRMDLLALRREEDGSRHFEVIEVKMGNSVELKDGAVVNQIREYIEHLSDHLPDYRDCYARNLAQQLELGLVSVPRDEDIQICDRVSGRLVVAGYASVAREAVERLAVNGPDIAIRTFFHQL